MSTTIEESDDRGPRRGLRGGTGAAGTPARTEAAPADGEAVAVYLRDASEVPLLDARQEVELAAELARARRGLGTLVGRLPRGLRNEVLAAAAPLPRRRGEWSLDDLNRVCAALDRHGSARRDPRTRATLDRARALKARLDRARDHMVLANLRLVVHVAKKFSQQGVPLLDLIQEGNLGLMKAVDRFRHTRGNRFSTYAFWWIKQAVERAVSNQARTVRVPVHVQEKNRRILQTSARLRTRLRREPATDEIAEALGQPRRKVEEVLRHLRGAEALEDAEGRIDGSSRNADRTAPSPYELARDRELGRRVDAALRSLEPREEQVLRLRYGLGLDAVPTLERIGDTLDLCRERVRQIERRALSKIVSGPHSKQLLQFVREK